MNPIDPHSDPSEAVETARRSSGPRAIEGLDRYLRWKVVDFLQNRHGDAGDLRYALADAVRWARSLGDETRDKEWSLLSKLLRDAQELPSAVEEQRLLEGRAAEVLRVVVERSGSDGVRPLEVRQSLGLSAQQVSNLVRSLEREELVARHGAGSRVWIVPTSRGHEVAERLPSPKTPSRSRAQEEEFWELSDVA